MNKKNEGFGVKIQEIKEISFSSKVTDDLIENFDDENVEIKLGFSVRGDFEKNILFIGVIVHFYSNQSTKHKEFLKLETSTSFSALNFTDDDIKFIDGNKEIFINDELMYVFLSTAIGATRGMLAYKIASLPINICLPIIDMDQLIPKNKKKPSKQTQKKAKK
ncbi:hypothetical protein BW723_12365 [Polaribacter reichenbachii]|uniref:Preprotein translocase subunit SecB n=1 Tax=Polaribacter reichenbachii TaxID=996801 RepID=A0A1B8U095_9FLAO|nr:hypothetical protein [Polaribacter reichenbachii]APZ47028.1 hypothetical protein BW723_12365 [Polaribacter reichenbachii]AUC17670.1 hypothetical protein BTO17_02815 [Polaribacter reichenbachii]OBY65308.1 hypothetical protein LPB301_09405 [Polaribacter reichenbachii]